MGLFEHWPYTNFHDLNLDWIIKKIPEVFTASTQAVQSAETAVSAKNDAVSAKEAAQLSAENAAASEESAGQSAESAQNYAENIADPVGGLVTGWLHDNITPTTPPVDTSLTVQGAAADAKKTGDELRELASEITLNSGVPIEVKRALDTMLQNVAFKNADGYTDEFAVFHAWALSINVVSISAVFNSGANTIYTDDTLEDLRQYLTVTATYDNGATAEVTAYTLSGDLNAGQNTIIVEYENKTASFTVNVVAPLYSLPNVAETELTAYGRTSTIKVENGLVTVSGSCDQTMYITKNGTATLTQPTNDPWFSAEIGSQLINNAVDISWNAPTGSDQSLNFKWANNDAAGNLASASLPIASASSGSGEETSFTVNLTVRRVYSAFAFQWTRVPEAGGICSFRVRVFIDGVRYF